ncbi:hypothetical protein DNTS_034220 [Danionella cerebrum]|uniref:Inactive hydroxysteroid dehydrogenase-like protein 1 n=1 Tax=Danionella cerebrum TaxID=2873325 RepID=A0A553QIY3_9TELE|nr:hypothetical protein DNTS_034220 [Danionella translucida]
MAAVDSFQLLYREIAKSCSGYVETLALVGACYMASKAIVVLKDCFSLIRVHFVPRFVCTGDLSQQFGQWAVICGVSEVIAKAYAEELARKGISLILISNNFSDVSDTAKAISDIYGVQVIWIEADFSQGSSSCKPLKEAICTKDIGFLVNSLDLSLDSSHNFSDLSEDLLWDIMNRNVLAITLVTRLVLPAMVERGRGAVVNISSEHRLLPTSRKPTLSASMAFLEAFSLSLHNKYGRQGVFVQSLQPFRVASQTPEGHGTCLVPSPPVYVRHALSTLGVSHRTTGYWPHTLQLGLVKFMPGWIWMLGSRIFTGAS